MRRALYRSRVMPLVTWGAWLRPLPARVVKQVSQLYRSLSRGHPMGSKPLRTILEGHHADSSFLSLHQSVQAAQRAHKFRRLRWRNSPSPAGWQHALVRGLSEYGWTPQRNWILQHPQEGQCNILHDGAAVLHKVRESWRRSLFAEFLSQKRRDSNLLRQQVGYDHMSCKVARCLYESSGNHGRAVLVGAALSSAVYCRIRKEPVPFHCSWCNQQGGSRLGSPCLALSCFCRFSSSQYATVVHGLSHGLATKVLFEAQCGKALAPHGCGAGAGDGETLLSVNACFGRLWCGVIIHGVLWAPEVMRHRKATHTGKHVRYYEHASAWLYWALVCMLLLCAPWCKVFHGIVEKSSSEAGATLGLLLFMVAATWYLAPKRQVRTSARFALPALWICKRRFAVTRWWKRQFHRSRRERFASARQFLSCDSCCAPAMFRFHDTVCTQPVQENMHSPRRKIFAYLCQPLSCMYCLLPAKCRFHFTVGSQHEQDRTKDVPTEPLMRGGGKNASCSATENRLLEGRRLLMKRRATHKLK